MLKIIDEKITNNYLTEVVKTFKINNTHNHQSQIVLYNLELTDKSPKDISFKSI